MTTVTAVRPESQILAACRPPSMQPECWKTPVLNWPLDGGAYAATGVTNGWPKTGPDRPFTSNRAEALPKQVTSYLGTFFRAGTSIRNDQLGQIIIVRVQIRDRDFQYLGQPCGR